MKPISCAVCHSNDYKVRYPEHIDYSRIDFSPRRAPSKNHCRIVECRRCGLVYANPIFDNEFILKLYRTSAFINERQVKLMGDDYLEQLRYASRFFGKKDALLEIGCGNGCFLKKAKAFGFEAVFGVEPSKHAVEQTDPEVRSYIINDAFHAELFGDRLFDLVCVIHVFDHLVDPNGVLENITKILKKNGFILAMSHNIRFLLTRILGERSPMYDIQHIYLFDKATLRRLFENHGFKVLYVKDMWSRYTIGHILKMFPFPSPVKRLFLSAIARLGTGDIKIKLMGGSIVALAQKVT